MIKHAVSTQYDSYAWLLDEDGNPVTGGAGSISVNVIDESDSLDSSPAVSEVDSTNAPGLYKVSFTPGKVGFWKVAWDSTVPDADISGGEVIYVCDVEVDEQDSYEYSDADTSEIDITEQFSTAWSTYYARRRTHAGTYFDFEDIVNDASAPDVTIRRYVKVDGSNFRKLDEVTYNNADLVADPVVSIDPLTLKKDYKMTIQLNIGLAAKQDLYYHYVIKFEDLCA